MKLFAFTVALLALGSWLTPVSAQVRGKSEPKSWEDKGHKSRGSGQDPNIKHKSDANNPKQNMAAPPDKGGPKTRGGSCSLTVDNWTQWKIQFFADGNYEDLVGGYAALSYSFGGTHVLYARADFDDGTYYYWGPRTVTCEPGGSYRWKLE